MEEALAALGSRATEPLASVDATRRALIINQFMRRVRNLTVRESDAVERDMLTRADAFPQGERPWQVKDALSLVALRNGVRLFCVCMGVDWAESMRMQSAVAELGRALLELGGGTVRLELLDRGEELAITIDHPDHTSPVALGTALRPLVEQMHASFERTYEVHQGRRAAMRLRPRRAA
ncbi:MAG: hypothetical protein HYV09_32940 [Deltaproteobacteria bacterium]|nr:hypothetical protein [Deltaproteobacteria bacterium]